MAFGDEVGKDAAKEDRLSHHMEIDNSLSRLNSAVDGLRELLDHITGGEEPVTEDPAKKPIPSLAEVLNEGAGRINSQADRVETLIVEIRAKLF